MMIVMGIDPGETTGWAVGNVGLVTTVVAYGQINGEELIAEGFDMEHPDSKYAPYRAVAVALMQVVVELEVEVVVIEDFTLRQMTTTKAEGISPVRIGMALDVWLHEIMPHGEPAWVGAVVWQTPAQAKTVVTDKRLKESELWIPGLPHACDAVRHVDLYRRKMQGI